MACPTSGTANRSSASTSPKHIDFDGSEFMSDEEWNESGACIGGFSGHDSAWSLMNTAVNATDDAFALNTTQYTFGMMVNSIAGVDPSQMSGRSITTGHYRWWV